MVISSLILRPWSLFKLLFKFILFVLTFVVVVISVVVFEVLPLSEIDLEFVLALLEAFCDYFISVLVIVI